MQKSDKKSCRTNQSPSALTGGQENGRYAWTPGSGCQHCGGRRPPVNGGGGTSARGCRELGDWLHKDEGAGLQLEAPHTSTLKMTKVESGNG